MLSVNCVDGSDDRYDTLDDGPEVEWRVRGSRFLGRVSAAPTATAAADGVRRARRQHHAATHHCWAARFGGSSRPVERFDDDGEPAGTAGRPILDRLRGNELLDVVIVVVRYFGGTKLGTGGLARAYSSAAALAIEAAPKRTVTREALLVVSSAYDDLGTVESAVARSGADVYGVERRYEGRPELRIRVRRSLGERLAATIVEGTGGRARVVIQEGEG